MSPRSPPKPRPSLRDYRPRENLTTGQPGPFLPLFFTVPTNPRPKERPRVVNGHTYTPDDTLRAEALVAAAARKAGAHPTTDPVRLVLRFYRSNLIRVDLDNLTKLVLDALNGTAYRDDSQIQELHALKFIDPTTPRTEVEVHPYPPRVDRVLDADEVAAVWAAGREGG